MKSLSNHDKERIANVKEKQKTKQSKKKKKKRKSIDLLACMFCFPISGRVMVPQRTVSFYCRLMYVHPRAYVCLINEKTKGKFLGEHLVV